MSIRQELAPKVAPKVAQDAERPELRLWEGDTLLAILKTTGPALLPPVAAGIPETPRLSRFALLRFDPGENHMTLECPTGMYRLILHDADTASWLARLGGFPNGGTTTELPAEAQNMLLEWLAAMNALTSAVDAPEVEGPDLAHWEFHDLLFHAQSRPGRRTGRIRPYRWRGVFEPLPVVKEPMGELLPLPTPGPLPAKPIGEVLTSRRSRRAFSDEPLSLAPLSTFLAHSCRIQSLRQDDLGGISFRPSPSAGALHGLEVYLLAERCAELKRGLYHYDPQRHGLERLDAKSPPTCSPTVPHENSPSPLAEYAEQAAKLDLLAEQARRMAASGRAPQAYFVITARFRRYQWKYAQLAYSVMLKDLGCLHQTMSLVAEALDLSSVILGDTPTEPFLSLAGLDWLTESPAGSFSLGLAPQN